MLNRSNRQHARNWFFLKRHPESDPYRYWRLLIKFLVPRKCGGKASPHNRKCIKNKKLHFCACSKRRNFLLLHLDSTKNLLSTLFSPEESNISLKLMMKLLFFFFYWVYGCNSDYCDCYVLAKPFPCARREGVWGSNPPPPG